jgi:hypothetical protein
MHSTWTNIIYIYNLGTKTQMSGQLRAQAALPLVKNSSTHQIRGWAVLTASLDNFGGDSPASTRL